MTIWYNAVEYIVSIHAACQKMHLCLLFPHTVTLFSVLALPTSSIKRQPRMSCSGSRTTTVMLLGQMNRGNYLKIDENGGLGMADELPNNRNPCKNITKLTLKSMSLH